MLLTGRSLWAHSGQSPCQDRAPREFRCCPSCWANAGYVDVSLRQGQQFLHVLPNAAFATNIETTGTYGRRRPPKHADRVVEFLRQHGLRAPRFSFTWRPPVPHDPRLAPAEFARWYEPAKLSLSKNFLPEHPFDNGELKIRGRIVGAASRATPEVMRQHLGRLLPPRFRILDH